MAAFSGDTPEQRKKWRKVDPQPLGGAAAAGELLIAARADHVHDVSALATVGHDHDADYADIVHDHDADYAAIDHAHDAAMVKIAEVSGDGSSGVLEFSSIPSTHRSLFLTIVGRTTAAVTSTPVLLTFETSPTAGAYNRQLMRGNNATASASEGIGGSDIYIGAMTGTTGPANAPGTIHLEIPEYAATTFFKTIFARQLEVDALTSGNLWLEIFGGIYESTSAIDRVRLTLTSGNWATGSRATLYGLPA